MGNSPIKRRPFNNSITISVIAFSAVDLEVILSASIGEYKRVSLYCRDRFNAKKLYNLLILLSNAIVQLARRKNRINTTGDFNGNSWKLFHNFVWPEHFNNGRSSLRVPQRHTKKLS